MSQSLPWLPEEVWEVILNNLEDSTDVWNVFRAFPQLDNSPVLQKKKPLWLFGLVIRVLIPWIKNIRKNTRMLRSCRQTCTHWSTSVDTFLETQPQLRPYDPENQGSGQFPWDPRWTYPEGRKNILNHVEGKWSIHIGGVEFQDVKYNMGGSNLKAVNKLLHAIVQHPPEKNPFLSRSLSISTGEGLGDDVRQVAKKIQEQFWNKMFFLHQKFGKHVWFYKLHFTNLKALDRGSDVAEWFAQLPNLKSLHLIGSEDMAEGHNRPDCSRKLRAFMKRLEKVLPPLPHLESLRIEGAGEFKHVGHLLIERLSAQAPIRRLELEFKMWKPEYSQMFPRLTELDLIGIDWQQVDVMKSIKNLFLSLEAPQLSKLQLRFRKLNDEDEYDVEKYHEICEIDMEDVFQWLKRFPMLKSFILNEGCEVLRIRERGTLLPETDSNNSLQFLSIRASFGMSFNFFRCLPSLLHLKFFVRMKPWVIDHSTNPVVRIREELQTGKLYDSNIFEVLPKLKTVNLLAEEKDNWGIKASYEFCREDYDKTKRVAMASGPTSEVNFSRLRKDILGYLKIAKRTSADFDTDDYNEESSDDSDSDYFDKQSADECDTIDLNGFCW